MMIDIPSNRKKMDPSLFGAGLSALRCPGCKAHLDQAEESDLLTSYYMTHTCGKYFGAEDADLTVRPDYQKYMNIRSTRQEIFWYHASDLPDWDTKILRYDDPLMVHIGSKHSALDRARYVGAHYLYKLQLKKEYKISPTVVDDYNYWPDHLSETKVPGENYDFSKFSDITRYVNRYEIPGSVSLLARADAVAVSSVSVLDS